MTYLPEFTITNNLLAQVAGAEGAKEIIINSPLIPAWERSFQGEAMIRTVHHSTAIEGNELDIKETEQVISGEINPQHRLRDVQEILNYRDAVNFISALKNEKLTTDLLLELHKIIGKKVIPENYLGKIRTKNAVIINSRDGSVVFDPTDHRDIEPELEELMAWDANSGTQLHPLLRAGILHYEIVRIHPFADLNGRTARIICTWALYRDGYEINRFFSLEEYYDQNPKSYYDALDSANSGDLTKWLEYFAGGVFYELKRIKDKVLDMSIDHKLKQKIGQVALNERQISIINYLVEKGEISNPEFRTILPEISDDTILRDIKDLMDKRIIHKTGKTKAARYLLN
jgi:Fic family protein